MPRPNCARRRRWTVGFAGAQWDTVAKRLVSDDAELARNSRGGWGTRNYRDFKTARRARAWALYLADDLKLPYVRVTHATPCLRFVRADWILRDHGGV